MTTAEAAGPVGNDLAFAVAAFVGEIAERAAAVAVNCTAAPNTANVGKKLEVVATYLHFDPYN